VSDDFKPMIEHYHSEHADGTEVRWDIKKWGQNWRVWKTTFSSPPKEEEVGWIYFSKREARAAALADLAAFEAAA